jgi:hypothetical protein
LNVRAERISPAGHPFGSTAISSRMQRAVRLSHHSP